MELNENIYPKKFWRYKSWIIDGPDKDNKYNIYLGLCNEDFGFYEPIEMVITKSDILNLNKLFDRHTMFTMLIAKMIEQSVECISEYYINMDVDNADTDEFKDMIKTRLIKDNMTTIIMVLKLFNDKVK